MHPAVHIYFIPWLKDHLPFTANFRSNFHFESIHSHRIVLIRSSMYPLWLAVHVENTSHRSITFKIAIFCTENYDIELLCFFFMSNVLKWYFRIGNYSMCEKNCNVIHTCRQRTFCNQGSSNSYTSYISSFSCMLQHLSSLPWLVPKL